MNQMTDGRLIDIYYKVEIFQEISLSEENRRIDVEKLEKVITKLSTKIELMEKELCQAKNDKMKIEKHLEDIKIKYLCLSNELSIEKERLKKDGVASQTQTVVSSF